MAKSFKERLQENLEKLNADEECIALYSDYTQAELEYNTMLNAERREAEAKGLKKGETKGLKKSAKNFLKLGIEPEIIAKGTGLSLNEIKMLR